MFKSPGYPGKYPDHKLCLWEIEGSKNITTNITIKFEHFRIESSDNCKFDKVTIYYKGIGEQNWMTDKEEGNRFCGSNIPTISTLTGKILIVFESDGNKNYEGFNGTYSVKSGNVNLNLLFGLLSL